MRLAADRVIADAPCPAAPLKAAPRHERLRRVFGELVGRLLRPRFWLTRVIRRIPFTGYRDALWYVDTRGEQVVALTLDDGPDHELTPLVLSTLKKHNAKATFFLLGEAAQRNEDVVDQIAAQGHELGNHTCIDESSAGLSEHDLRQKLSSTHNVLSRGNRQVRLFRPGGGRLGWRGRVATVAEKHKDYQCVLGSVYPNDVRIWSDSVIVKDVLRRVRPGGIIILHEGEDHPGQPPRGRVVAILEQVLEGLRDYRIVTVSQLLAAGDGDAHRPVRADAFPDS